MDYRCYCLYYVKSSGKYSFLPLDGSEQTQDSLFIRIGELTSETQVYPIYRATYSQLQCTQLKFGSQQFPNGPELFIIETPNHVPCLVIWKPYWFTGLEIYNNLTGEQTLFENVSKNHLTVSDSQDLFEVVKELIHRMTHHEVRLHFEIPHHPMNMDWIEGPSPPPPPPPPPSPSLLSSAVKSLLSKTVCMFQKKFQ